MEKWSVRGQEMRGGDDASAAAAGTDGPNQGSGASAARGNESSSSQGGVVADTPSKVTKTPDGKPICLLCRRKFASLEKLRQHERVSALHKQNLAKKKAAAEEEAKKKKEGSNGTSTAAVTAPPSPAVDYRDRAKERRALFGPDAAAGAKPDEEPVVLGPDLDRARAVASAEVVAPHESLGESNIGNKMLQKLGWKRGGALGREQQQQDLADGGVGVGSVNAKDTLKSDWERIESLAGGNSHNRGQAGVGGGDPRSLHQ
uniref:G-patch domain-containing protein n=1 Tax=Pseudictyota dubia TaxID=2749911 RepID=A0A7R9W9B1_9STRA